MKNKKLIIIVTAAVLILGAIIYFLVKQPRSSEVEVIPETAQTAEEKELGRTTETAITKLQNFTDSTTDEYVNSLKPYLSDEMFENEKELAKLQKEFNDKQGFATTQKYTVSKVELIEHENEDGEILTYKVTGTIEYKDSQEEDVTYVKYMKINDQWKIIDFIPAD